MKLATLKDGSRDGLLAVVSRDLRQAHHAAGIATTLQQVLDDWNFVSPQLEELAAALNAGRSRHPFEFDPRQCLAPLPRACLWIDGPAYPAHVEALAPDPAAEAPEGTDAAPRLDQAGSDDFLGPGDDAVFGSAGWGIDFGATVAVICDDVAIGSDAGSALAAVRLLMLANAWTLRVLMAAERSRGGGLVQSKPAAAFSPVAVTPDEVGAAWSGGRLHLALRSLINGRQVGLTEAGPEMSHPYGTLIAHVARTRRLRAGGIVGGGPVSNRDPSRGASCIADLRAAEARRGGEPLTPYLQSGDTVRIEMADRDGSSVFGAIEQRVVVTSATAAES